jgi:hypothetical protein
MKSLGTECDGSRSIGVSERRRSSGSGACPINLLRRNAMSLGTILLVVLVLLLIGAFPTWPHSQSWGYFPSGGLGLVLLIVIILLVMGKL